MDSVLYNISHNGKPITVEAILEHFDLPEQALDKMFGVQLVSRSRGLYCILIDSRFSENLRSSNGWKVDGPFDNPPLTAYGT
ncbi:MAG: hypothetical protein O7G85_06785 [Planctomycetota bacterium]|nr:hypothetical protein [Planctomycetota bacterium]